MDMLGAKRLLNTSLRGMSAVTWSADNKLLVLSDQPSTHLVTVGMGTGDLVATRYVGVTPRPAAAAMKLPVPYIQQVRDTAENGDGTWACGPTSVAMALAYFKRIEPWSVAIAAEHLAQGTQTAAGVAAAALDG